MLRKLKRIAGQVNSIEDDFVAMSDAELRGMTDELKQRYAGGESLDEADFRKRPVKFMYADATHMHFLDQEDYNQYSLAKDDLTEESKYLTEDMEGIQSLIYNDECVGIQLPVTVELKVVQCDPGIKGSSATSRSKPATLQTGLVVQVPEYLSEGEVIKVDTRTGEYLSRA